MTPSAMRVAVAEACGWSVRYDKGDPFKYFCRPGEVLGACCGIHLTTEQIFKEFFVLGDCGPSYVVPDYPNDLNACHEMEMTLTDKEWRDYCAQLASICDVLWPQVVNPYNMRNMISATALQRCEAYLKVKGLWEGKR